MDRIRIVGGCPLNGSIPISFDLQLAALEVFPERRPQPFGARGITLPVA